MNPSNTSFPTPEIPLDLLHKMPASWQDLLASLSLLMTDEMLQHIAAADYGYEAEKCFIYLKQLVTTQEIPKKVAFIVTECLALTRWSVPKNREEHLCRAFSCCLLLLLVHESNYTPVSDENETLVGLIESSIKVGLAPRFTQNLIVWRLLADYKEEEAWYIADQEEVSEITLSPFFIYGLLLLMVFNQEEPTVIERILDWSIAMDEEAKKYALLDEKGLNQPFLLGTTYFKQRHEVWKQLSQQMNQWRSYITNQPISNKLEQLIKQINQ